MHLGCLPKVKITGYRAAIAVIFIYIWIFQKERVHAQDSIPIPEPGYLVISGGLYSCLDTWATTGFFNFQLLPGCKWWVLRPQAGFLISFSGAYMIYAGVTWPARPVKWLVIETGAAMGYYENGEGINLAYPLEFRLSLSVLYRFRNSVQLGVEVVHISNADMGMPNPGTESVGLILQLPLRRYKAY